MTSCPHTDKKYFDTYRRLIVIVGVGALAYSSWRVPQTRIDLRFLLLTVITILVSSRASIRIPRVNANVTVSDTFIFLMLLLYGSEAGVLLAATEGLFAGFRISRRPLTVLFNSAMMVCSTSLTALVVPLAFGPVSGLRLQNWSVMIPALGIMALTMYFANTGLSAIGLAIKERHSIWKSWQNNYLWLSITYIVGAAVAGIIANPIDRAGVSVLAIVTPIIAIIYLTYQRYLDDIRTTSAQAEQAERARAEAERKRAEQAEHHVEELNVHIAEQMRISEELQKSKEHFRHAAFHDGLTGLANRALLSEELKVAIDRARHHEHNQFAMLFLDLDRFKNVNDSLGHPIGDQLLIAIARRLEACIREQDVVARLGGDEFAILLNGISGADDAIKMAQRVQERLQSPFNLSGHEVFTSTSIGIAPSGVGYEQPESVLRDADTAMYTAKSQGTARHEVFDKGMHARVVQLLQLETDLRRAVERQEFALYYQPIVSLDSGELAGFEALVRWQHPERGIVSPGDFISLAEDTGLIVPLGEWVLEEACRQLVRWQWRFPNFRELFMSVNLSAKQIGHPGIVEQVDQVLRKTNLSPCHLKLEITESAVMENPLTAVDVLNELKALGVQLSMDDFGTGYSSLSYLHRFPLDTLKIDRSFVSRIGEGDDNSEIVRTVVTLAEHMRMEVVAEGVETREQLDRLKEMKCRYGQGYFFARPLDATSMTEWIASTPETSADNVPRKEYVSSNQGAVLALA